MIKFYSLHCELLLLLILTVFNITLTLSTAFSLLLLLIITINIMSLVYIEILVYCKISKILNLDKMCNFILLYRKLLYWYRYGRMLFNKLKASKILLPVILIAFVT